MQCNGRKERLGKCKKSVEEEEEEGFEGGL